MIINNKLIVIGGGSWGTALACLATRGLGYALVYTQDENMKSEINRFHKNTKYLKDTILPEKLEATTNFADVAGCGIIIIATPSYAFESTIEKLKKLSISKDSIILIATKGLCQNPVQLFSQKLESHLNNPYGFISGPNFAQEVAEGKFASITITTKDISLSNEIAKILAQDNLNISVSDDIITVQIASIVKNIVAIKSGILQAEYAGENARAWVISQGLQEIADISSKLGGDIRSLTLPAVIGDLVLTSYSTTSRNTKFGYDFCKNNYSKDFLKNYPILIEGVQSARLISKFVQGYDLNLPIISSIASLVS